MKKVKILYFVDRLLIGGIQSLLLNWGSRFDKEKLQVDFLVLDDGQDYELENRVHELGCNLYKLNGIWINSPFDYIKYARTLDCFFREHNDYDVVHMNSSSKNYMVLKYAQKYGIPTRIAHSHNIDFQTKNIFKKMVGNVFKKFLIKYSTDFFACSTNSGIWLFGDKIVNSDRFKIIHNAVDYEVFKYNEKIRLKIRNEFNFSEKDLVIGHVGRFSNQKNHSFLIDIFYEIQKKKKDSKLLLIGIGENEDLIRDKVNSLGIKDRVVFAGFRKDVNELMNGMDVFLLPSLHEGLPVVGVEAQASGLPCFMSKDVITDEIKVSPSLKFIPLSCSPSEWAEQILNSDLKRQDNKLEFKKAGYLIDDIVKQLEEFYCSSNGRE